MAYDKAAQWERGERDLAVIEAAGETDDERSLREWTWIREWPEMSEPAAVAYPNLDEPDGWTDS